LPDDPAIHFAPGLAWCTFAVERNPRRRSPRTLRRRLNALSDRHGGARAITQRTREIPQAYRAHYGDERSPAEELTIKRLIRGQYRSRGVLRDALLIATIDTEVGVYALDADRVVGEPRLAGREIVDDDGPLAPLFADPGAARPTGLRTLWARPPRDARHRPEVAVTRATRRITLFAVTAPGIADLATEEALLSAYDIIAS
jgi:hypothetical protein